MVDDRGAGNVSDDVSHFLQKNNRTVGAAALDRYLPERIQRVDFFFVILCSQKVVITILGVDPECRIKVDGTVGRTDQTLHHLFW